MIETIVSKFQSFRNHLFRLFFYRAGATMDLIDTVAAEGPADSVVKLSLSSLFRRKYSSLTDVLNSMFRVNLKRPPRETERAASTRQITQLLAQECAPGPAAVKSCTFVIDCTADPRIYADKVKDRTIVHAPNRVPHQKPITVGHEYSVLAYLPSDEEDQALHWLVPLSVKRVQSYQTGPEVGLEQLEEILHKTVFKDYLCISLGDAAYSTSAWAVKVYEWENSIHISRMRSNRKVYRLAPEGKTRRGRPLQYGQEILLSDPIEPDVEEITTTVIRRDHRYQVLLQRWKNVVMKGTAKNKTHQTPFDLVRITVTDKKGKAVYKRPLWLGIMGERRKEVTSKQAYQSYGRRYDIEHYFRFGKQKLGLVDHQTSETTHEENWHWVCLLAYNMLYQARHLTQAVRYPWEKRTINVLTQRPTQVRRDYERIIREIGTPAPVPKPRGKSPGRQKGEKVRERPDQPLIRKKTKEEEAPPKKKRGRPPKLSQENLQIKREKWFRRMRRLWRKNRPAPMRC